MANKPRLAAIMGEFRPLSHADVILTKYFKGFPTDDGIMEPRCEIASMYVEQFPEKDMARGYSKELDVPIYESINHALTLGGDELAVDGVIIIGEHGNYPSDEKGRHMYPRRYFWEQVCGVIASSGKPIPIFNDKHLSYNWDDAWWMYSRGKELNIPMLAGSTLTLCWRNPWLEFDETPMTEAIAVGYGGMEAYGYHTVETLQCMVERRKGGETGVQSVQTLVGDAVWKAGEEGLWSIELAEAAVDKMVNKPVGIKLKDCEKPEVFLIQYSDGLKAAVLQLNGIIQDFGFAARTDKGVEATEFYLQYHREHNHFAYLGLNIEEMMLTGEPPWAIERTLIATGIINAVMDSNHEGFRQVETPGMANLAYKSYDKLPRRPTGFRPEAVTIRDLPTLSKRF